MSTETKQYFISNEQKGKDNKAKPYQVKQVREFFISNKIIADE